jgi:O-antigen ligase
MKSADASIHLAGAALFALMFSERRRNSDQRGISFFSVIGFVAWVPSVAIVLLATRAGFMAIMVPILVVTILRFRRIGWKTVAVGMAVLILCVGIVETNLITFTIRDRQFSEAQLSAGVTSIFGSSEHTELEGTKEWRLGWWENIIQYTVFGPYFWTGKGFGVNLAVEDGPPGMTAEETSLRSPHNGSMTVLARMGVPGAVLWVAMNLSFIFRMLAGFRRASVAGLRFWTSVNLWILCFWLAGMINLSFDVYVEGPVGGMWFWATMGFGLAALRVQAHEARLARTEARLEMAV